MLYIVELYQLIRNDFAKRFLMTERTGRNSTPLEVVLRMLPVAGGELAAMSRTLRSASPYKVGGNTDG